MAGVAGDTGASHPLTMAVEALPLRQGEAGHVNMLGKGSPRLTMLLSKAAQKKNSPKCRPTKKHGGSPIEKSRASWNPTLEKILAELLHEHNTPEYRGQNGWTSKAWNKIVKEFHERIDMRASQRSKSKKKRKS
uniref:Myb/SANT-like domain-containing protein n=1 Tax=Oryza punctata TaxID=4537 RepID=A0A0E0JT32_ORYPU